MSHTSSQDHHSPASQRKAFRCRIGKPLSSNSSFDTHIFLNVASEASIDPPIQVVSLRSVGAQIRIFMSLGANFLTSFRRRSQNFSNIVEPPESTICEKSVVRKSRSARFIESASNSWIPGY